MPQPRCRHDLDHPIRKGRAQYVCPKCGADITLLLVIVAEEKGKKDAPA